MLSNRIVSRLFIEEDTLPEPYVWASDDDFSGTSNGSFKYIGTKEYVAIPNRIKGINITSYFNMFKDSAVIKGVASFNKSIANINNMFYINTSITSLDLKYLDISNVTNMNNMFNGCSSLTSLDLSNFNTSNVTTMTHVFRDCAKLTSLDLSNFDTTKVTTMAQMFFGCSSLTSLDLSSFNTRNVTDMDYIVYNCSKVTTAYARTQSDADKLNASIYKPATLTFVVKS